MFIFGLLLVLMTFDYGALQNVGYEDSLITSIAGLEQLLETEKFLIENLESYAKELEEKLLIIRSVITSIRKENDKAHEDVEYYLSIPTNVFSLVRRLQKDWTYLDIYMKKSVGDEQIKILRDQWYNLPKESDLVEAVQAISRLQDTYDLNAADLANGVINGREYDTQLTALDCYTLGYELFNQKEFISAGFWLYTAIQLYSDDEITKLHSLSQSKVMELYAEILLRQSRHQDALSVLNAILDLPTLLPPESSLIHKKVELEKHIQIYNPQPVTHTKREPTEYQRGCRGEFESRGPMLYCLYNSTTTAYLKLAPLKMEIVSLDPYIVLYHDVMSDEEISTLQDMARPVLQRATVYSEEDKRSKVDSGRTSKFAWFSDNRNEITKRINKRIEDMTGFDLLGSEMLQVMNYGLGGHYNTHYDFFNVSMTTDVVSKQGDRKATVLFYMTDVEQGGATVFPNIETAIFPQKGTAVVWYNLNRRYEGDPNTMHAGCPVLVGSKWVTNKWIRERNQMFRLPCADQ